MTPNSLSMIGTDAARELGNHLWQSTLFAGVVALLALALRKYQARTRYWLWLAASVKFLIPFSLLIAMGSHLVRPGHPTESQTGMYAAVDEMSRPFTKAITLNASTFSMPVQSTTPHLPIAPLAAVWLGGIFVVFAFRYAQWRAITNLLRRSTPFSDGREVEALRKMERIARMSRRIEVISSPGSLEPGVFGFVRPVLLWPEGISHHLDDAHLEAIVTHEVCHVQRRDNLTSAIHMMVEALFWYHPLVWWMEKQLVKERERACDQNVLELCNQPQAYAESLLRVCEFCVESSLPCISGITGADLKKRVVQIMTEGVVRKLDFCGKLLLLAFGFVIIAVSIMLGKAKAAERLVSPVLARAALVYETQPVASPAMRFEVATVKPNVSGCCTSSRGTIDQMMLTNQRLRNLVVLAYGVQPNQVSGPDWMDKVRFDITAKYPPGTKQEDRWLMLRTLLEDRFKLTTHSVTKEMLGYSLQVAKTGFKLKPSDPGEASTSGGSQGSVWTFNARKIPLSVLMYELSDSLGEVVVNQTGLNGVYDFQLRWSTNEATGPGVGESEAAPSVFTALEETLGLRLQHERVPAQMIVVDQVERMPTEN